jgi:hypothetical protein
MASKEIGPDGVETWLSKGGVLCLRSPAPGILAGQLSGDLPEDLAPAYNAFLQGVLAQAPRIMVFLDAAHLVNYETGYRQRTVSGHKAADARIEALHILFGSKLVALGVQAANIILRNMVAHTSRAAFDAALAKAIAERACPR